MPHHNHHHAHHWYELAFHPGFWSLVFVFAMAAGIAFYAAATPNHNAEIAQQHAELRDAIQTKGRISDFRSQASPAARHHANSERLYRSHDSYQQSNERQPLLQSPVQPFSASTTSSTSSIRNDNTSRHNQRVQPSTTHSLLDAERYSELQQSLYHTDGDSMSDKLAGRDTYGAPSDKDKQTSFKIIDILENNVPTSSQ